VKKYIIGFAALVLSAGFLTIALEPKNTAASNRESPAVPENRETEDGLRNRRTAQLIQIIQKLQSGDIPLTTYEDYENELNIHTVEKSRDTYELFEQDSLPHTKSENAYCTEIFLENVTDKLIAMMQISGSGRFPYVTIFAFNPEKKLYEIYAEFAYRYLIPVEIDGLTHFLEIEGNFDIKTTDGYGLFELKNKKLHLIDTLKVEYEYQLSADDKKWISAHTLKQMAAFDYSSFGYKEDHPDTVKINSAGKEIIGTLYYTSVGYFPSNYTVRVLENAALLQEIDSVWGFTVVNKENKDYLVYIGMGEDSGDIRYATFEEFYLNVIDLQTMHRIYKRYITSQMNLK